MTHTTWHLHSLTFLHDAARTLALASQGHLLLTRHATLAPPARHLLASHLAFTHSADTDQAPLTFLLDLLHDAGFLAAVDRTERVSAAALDWLDQPHEAQLQALRLVWLLHLDSGWRWLLADRRPQTWHDRWTAATTRAFAHVAALPTDSWTPTPTVIAEVISSDRVLFLDNAAHLPATLPAFLRDTHLLLHFLLTEILPALGLVERQEPDELRPTAEGIVWLQAALSLAQSAPRAASELTIFSELRFPKTEEPTLTVTPALHVIIAASAPLTHTFEIMQCARLLSLGPPAVYQITRRSLEQAAARGYPAGDLPFLLDHLSDHDFPAPARAQILSWLQQISPVTCEPGYRLRFPSPANLSALLQRAPFRRRIQRFAAADEAWVSQAQSHALFRYLRRLGYLPLLPADTPADHLPLQRSALPVRQLLVALITYDRLRRMLPSLAKVDLTDLERSLAAALTPADEAAVARLVESHADLLRHAILEESQGDAGCSAADSCSGDDLIPRPPSRALLSQRRGKGEEWRAEGEVIPLLARLATAIAAGDAIDLTYVDTHGQVTQRRVHPLRLETRGGCHYLVARCELRGEERRFRVDRIVTEHLKRKT